MAYNKATERCKSVTSRREFIVASAPAGLAATVLATQKPLGNVHRGARDKCYGMVIDLRRCIGCHACSVACKSEFNVPLGVWRSWVKITEDGKYPNVRRTFLPKLCNNCRKTPCISVCPTGASHYDEHGVSSINQNKCIGCGLCVGACPYKMRFVNPEKRIAEKCTLCMHRVAKGVAPACVNTCVGRARVFGDFNDPESEVSSLVRTNKTATLRPQLGTKPQVYYIGDFDE
ncbi:MAG TPA: 4Fe-4S dicluster domain-containing protein [Sedimentisphaerales bacterium]|nr:4Fe-4S dicluster domain-containing protein [Sedimentisphaerales bacterium]